MGIRYSLLNTGHYQREIVLLKGYPCGYGKCRFCNYIEDNSSNDKEIKQINEFVLSKVTGKYGILEVLNSGSVFEIPSYTLQKIRQIVDSKKIKILIFEIYYGYIKRIPEIQAMFPNQEIRFKMGLETFDNDFRIREYGKNFTLYHQDLIELADSIHSVCLLVCTKGQTQEMLDNDIQKGLEYFPHITVNVFINNGTAVQRDENLVQWFIKKYQYLQNNPRVEMLIDNKDLGVFEQ